MNASQLATYVSFLPLDSLSLSRVRIADHETSSPFYSYDVFKNMIISLDMMKDGLGLHFTSSFLAVSLVSISLRLPNIELILPFVR